MQDYWLPCARGETALDVIYPTPGQIVFLDGSHAEIAGFIAAVDRESAQMRVMLWAPAPWIPNATVEAECLSLDAVVAVLDRILDADDDMARIWCEMISTADGT